MVEYPEDLVAQQRAGLLVMYLMLGRSYTVDDAARLLGLKPRGARYLLQKLSGVLPIAQEDGAWQWVR